MGVCGENTASEMGITRAEQDAYAIGSYHKSAAAWDSGVFDAETFAVTIKVILFENKTLYIISDNVSLFKSLTRSFSV